MGSANGNAQEAPVHSVRVNDFIISKYEITNDQYAQFLNDIGAESDGSFNGIPYIKIKDPECQLIFSLTQKVFMAKSGHEDCAVSFVSWEGARAYAEHYGGRLPTEAEWEYAARGGKFTKNYIYSGSNIHEDCAMDASYGVDSPVHVGMLMSNELGLYDMSGNVWEWCNDWYDADYYAVSPENNPQGPPSGDRRSIRGGGFKSGLTSIRVSARMGIAPSEMGISVGFRPVFDH
jgi:formylglycine-generating enzyme required for sulfatase activity